MDEVITGHNRAIRWDRGGRLMAMRVSFVMAHVLFLWMYLAADNLERMASQHIIDGPAGTNALRAAYDHAAAWRHGMAGNSFLYLPGFFAAAAFTWVWSLGRPLRRLAIEGAVLVAAASAVAALAAPFGAARCLASFEQATGLHDMGVPAGFTAQGFGVALYTIFTWDAEMICCQLSIARRSVRLMWIPIALNMVLAQVRPWTVSDFTNQWLADLVRGEVVAVISAGAVPILAVFLVLYQLKTAKSIPSLSSFPGNPRITTQKPTIRSPGIPGKQGLSEEPNHEDLP